MEEVSSPIEVKLSQVPHVLGIVAFYSVFYVVFFSPVIFSDRVLAPGDGIHYYFPNFYLGKMFWDLLILSGFPVAADPQAMTWYPLSWIFSLMGSWNSFVLSAYVFSSSFTYGYVFTLTRSKLAGLASGIIYGMSGFMMIHLGHTSIIHTAAWLPLLIWALEMLRHRFTPSWFVVASLAIALSALSGHPQIFVYTLGICSLYAGVFGWSSGLGRWKYYGIYLLALFIGFGLSSIQLLPALELVKLGPRSEITFQEFVSYSLPAYQAIKLFFPFLFGGFQESFYGFPYFGKWNLNELTGYVGLLSLLLMAIGVLAYPKKSMKWFWACVGLFTFLLTLGDLTPLAKISYHVPFFNKFRVPARHFLEFTLAVSILSGMGILAIQKQIASSKLIIKTLFTGSGIMLGSLTTILLFSTWLKAFATKKGIVKIEFLPWLNPAVGIPLIIFILSSIVLFFWCRKSHSRFRQIILISILIIDLSSFDWFTEWKYHSPGKNLLIPPASAQRYKNQLENTYQRMIPIRGVRGLMEEIPPNISRLWGIPSASGYGPLILSRISNLLSMCPCGGVTGNWSSLHNRNLDLMAIRYVFIPKHDTIPTPVIDPKGISWSSEDLNLSIGSGCGSSQPSSVKINLPVAIKATSIGMVSAMACSTAIPDESEVIRILVTDIYGKVHSVSVLAGRDTSEWAFDCHDVLPQMKHRRAQIFQSFPVVREHRTEKGHRYVTILPLGNELEIKHLELQWVGPSALIGIQKISLFDEKNRKSYPLSHVMSDLADPVRWRHIEDIGGVSVYENLRAMPRAWLVPEVVSAKPEEVLRTIKSSRLPDGRTFNPFQTALVEAPLIFKAMEWDEKATAQVVHLSNTQIEIHTNSRTASFLVLSDVYYPGWEATIDGIRTNIFQTNYVLRGVMVPQGGHIIKFEFKPKVFYIGATISAISFLFLISIISYQATYSKKRLKDEFDAPSDFDRRSNI